MFFPPKRLPFPSDLVSGGLLFRVCSFFLLVFIIPQISFGGGAIHGAKAAGMGTAFTAVADDASAILFNPAGLTQLDDSEIMGGVTAVSISTSWDGSAGASEDTKPQFYFPPHLYIGTKAGTESWAFGIGLHSPFGIGGRNWDEDGDTRYLSTRYLVSTLAINPTVAWQPHPAVSFGVGIDYMWSDFELKRKVDQSLLGYSDGDVKLDADGWGWGWNVGILFRLGGKGRMGAAYRSPIKVKADGKITLGSIAPALQPAFGNMAKYSTGVDTDNKFPEIFSFGVAWFPSPAITLAFDADWVRWSSFDDLELDVKGEVPAAGFTDINERLDWKDSWQLKVGCQWALNQTWQLRAGYAYVQTYVPESTLGPGNPDANQHNVSVGVGAKTGRFRLDAFGAYGWFDKRHVDNDVLDGTYRGDGVYLGGSLSYTFSGSG